MVQLNNALSITGTVITYISFYIHIYIFFSLSTSSFLFFPTTDLKRNNSCNYSACLVFTLLSSFFAYLSLMYSLLYDILCIIMQNKMVVVVVKTKRTEKTRVAKTTRLKNKISLMEQIKVMEEMKVIKEMKVMKMVKTMV